MFDKSIIDPSVSLNPGVSIKYIGSVTNPIISLGTSMLVIFFVTEFELGQAIKFLTPSMFNNFLGVFQINPFQHLVMI